jgi:hypothetical protein
LAADQQQSHDQNQAAPIFCPTGHNDMSVTDETRTKRGSCAHVSVENPTGY